VFTDGVTWRLLIQPESGANQKFFRARSPLVGSLAGATCRKERAAFRARQKSRALSPHHRFMNALHTPVCFAETGLLPCPAEKKAAKLADTLNHHTFSGPVSKEESPNSADFSLFPEQSRRISLHCRLYGGEGGIRTPGTVSRTPVFKTGAFNHSATSPATTVLLQGPINPPDLSAVLVQRSDPQRLCDSSIIYFVAFG
jgi:hypothetical protein